MNLYTFFIIAFCAAGLSLKAQKLPDVQPDAVPASSALKVDGKLADGTEPFLAYNKNTKLFYTLSNDDKNLYLVMKSTDAANINKILLGGITFSVNASGKKKEKDVSSITFPVIVRQVRGSGQRGQGQAGGFGRTAQQGQTVDSAAIIERRKQQIAGFKEIKVLGFKSITDTLISIYNEHSIKAAIGYDAKGNFVYELAISFELAGLSQDKEFAYNIKVNGREMNFNFVRTDGGGSNGGGFGGGGFGGGGMGRSNFDPSMFEPVDFWGKYLPAKK